MALGLFRRLLGNRKDIEADAAGVHAVRGQPPSVHAIDVCRKRGVDISSFRSQPLTVTLVDRATHIFAMTGSHLETIHLLFPQSADKTFLLREFEEPGATLWRDLPDPIGMGREVYDECADSIEKALPSVLAFVEETEIAVSRHLGGSAAARSTMGNMPHHLESEAGDSHSEPSSGNALRKVDPEIYEAIAAEERRQRENIELIASENFTSRAVMEAQGSCLTNKYAEGYPGKRWYGGCENVDVVEQLAIDRALKIFGAEHVNVQPHSGAQANMAVYFAAIKPGDRILTMNLAHGGHLTHGHPANFSGKLYEVTQYGVSEKTEQIDYDALAKQAEEVRPAMITAGASAYPRFLDFPRLRQIADSVDALLFIDMAHIAGLVAAGEHPSPVPHAHFVTTTTHKSLRGPRGGIVLCQEKFAKAIDSSVFPGGAGRAADARDRGESGLFPRSAPAAVPRVSATGGSECKSARRRSRQTRLPHRFGRHGQSSHAGRSAAERDQREGRAERSRSRRDHGEQERDSLRYLSRSSSRAAFGSAPRRSQPAG